MELMEADDTNWDIVSQDSGICLSAFLSGLHDKIISDQAEKLKFIGCKYVSNSHQIILEEYPTAQNIFTDCVWKHYIIQLVSYTIQGSILPVESKVSGKSSYILLGAVQEREGYEPMLSDWIVYI